MSVTTRDIEASPDEVWSVLADGWLYPLWVVGASRMREVDDAWPRVGAQLHHSVGAWPALVDDDTEVLECETGARLVLEAKAWPFGTARVVLTLRPKGSMTEVSIDERAVRGPGSLMPGPLQDPVLHWRNVETLRRLAYVVENRAAGPR